VISASLKEKEICSYSGDSAQALFRGTAETVLPQARHFFRQQIDAFVQLFDGLLQGGNGGIAHHEHCDQCLFVRGFSRSFSRRVFPMTASASFLRK
jgi:hypothetical protein